ncbi:MAG: hypothetical protein J6A21_01245, partial [Lentisphaeria bacterium]|nr:hypothetical protein [Lentisphaeria bacterium]
HFETISEQRRKLSNLRLSLTISRVETVSGQLQEPRPVFARRAKTMKPVKASLHAPKVRFMIRRIASYAIRRASFRLDR